MSKITKKLVERFISLNLNPVPVKKDSKEPLRKAHQTSFHIDEIDDYDWANLDIGVSTGYASLNLEALDFDLKNIDNPDEFIKNYNSLIPSNLFDKLVIQKTPSGGYHYIYRCDSIESNQKLARNKRGEAVIETRGVGGYIKCFPSKGYELISEKSFDEIPYITEEERSLLINLAKQKDKLLIRDLYKKYSDEDLQYLKKFPDYNKDENIGIKLLEEAGWTFHSENGDWYNMTRPNSTSHDLHGGYNLEGKFFQTFSTAQDTFIERKGYNNHHLFAELVCDGNYKKAYAKLYEDGWGAEEDDSDEDDDSLSFISSFEYENEYLDQARKGEVPLGVSLGWTPLDPFLKLKKNSFYFWLGLDNIGKSTLLASVMAATKVMHGFKWGISSPEAQVYTTRRTLIEAETGKRIGDFEGDPETYQRVLQESRDSFIIINNEKHYSIDEILEKGKVLYQHYGIDFLLIDPFSFYSGAGNYADDTEVLSKIRVFCQNYCSVIVVDHPSTAFARTASDSGGFSRMPTKYDVSGGNSKANRCDDFICFHRIINHPDEDIRKTMQISVQKVKDKATGGKPHLVGDFSELIYEQRDGFLGYWDTDGRNPMYEALMSKAGVQKEMKRLTTEEAFL